MTSSTIHLHPAPLSVRWVLVWSGCQHLRGRSGLIVIHQATHLRV